MTTQHPKISVLMPVHNGEKYLAEAIKTILDQSFADFEFLIMDDGSTDSTPQILKEFALANAGIVKSLNRLVDESRTDLLARQDADDISYPDRFKLQYEYMQKHPETVLLGTLTKFFIEGMPGKDHPNDGFAEDDGAVVQTETAGERVGRAAG